MTKQNDVISPEVVERGTLTTFDYAPPGADAETRFDAEGNADGETKRREAARLRAARQMLFDANVDELDDANAVALFNSVSKSVCGLPDATGDIWFGRRKSADPRENLKMMRRVFQGEWDLIEDAEAKEFNAKSPEEQREQALENEGVLQKAGRWLKVGALSNHAAAASGVGYGDVRQPDLTTKFATDNLAASEAERTAKERFRVNARQKLLTLMAHKGAVSDRAALVMTKSLAEGGIDPRDMAALTKEDQESVFAGFAAVRGEATHGEMLGGLVDMDFADGTDVGNRAQMALYGAWNGLCGIFTTPFEFGDTLIDWGRHGLVPFLATKAGAMNAADRAAHKAALDYEQLKDRCAEALTQPLPEGGFFGAAAQGLAENWMWFIPYGAYAKAVGGAAKAAETAKGLKQGVVAAKAAVESVGSAERTAKYAMLGAKRSRDLEKIASAYARIGVLEKRYAEAAKRYGEMAKRLGAANRSAWAWKGAVAGAKYMTVSNFAQEFVETADAAGMDRETSVPLALAVGFVNDKIERIEVPGLDEHITPAVLRGIGGHALVEALKRNKKAVWEYLKRFGETSLKSGAAVGFNEGFVEEPLQQIVTDHALLMQKDIEEARKGGFKIGDFAAKEIVRQLAATPRDLQTWFEVAGDMLPMAFGYLVTSGLRELATAKAREWSRNSESGLAKGLKFLAFGEGEKNEGWADYVTRRERTRAAVRESLAEEEASVAADAATGKTQAEEAADGAATGKTQAKEGFDPAVGFEDKWSDALKLLERERARVARRLAKADDLMQKGRDAYRKRGKDGAAEAIMRETGMPRVVAEQMAEFYSIEEIYETAGAAERRTVREPYVAEVNAETLAAHANVVPGSVMTDAKTGNVAATFDFGGKQVSVVYQKDFRAPFLNEDGTVNEEKLHELTADDSSFAVSWNEQHDEQDKWEKMDVFERRRALLYMNGNNEAGGHFVFADANGETVEIDADSVVQLAQSRLTDLAYKILPPEMAEAVEPSALSNGWTLEHETFHSCWRVVRMTLRNEEIVALAEKMGVKTNGEAAFTIAADGTRRFAAWTKKLDEAMAYDFQYYASGRYVAQPARDAIERGMRKLADWGGRLFKEKEARHPKTGEAFTLKDFYDAVLEGRIGSGNMGIERIGGAKEEDRHGRGDSQSPRTKENEIPVGVSAAELAEQEKKEESAADEAAPAADAAEENAADEAAPGADAAGGKTQAEEYEPQWDGDHGTWGYLKIKRVGGEDTLVRGKFVVVNVHDVKTSFQKGVKNEAQNRTETDESKRRIEWYSKHPDFDVAGRPTATFGGSTLTVYPNMLAIAGNHRITALQAAAKLNGEAWRHYVEMTLKEAARRGIEADAHALEAPVLVFVADGQTNAGTMSLFDLGKESNESDKQKLTPEAEAISRSGAFLKLKTASGLVYYADGRLNVEKSRDALKAFFGDSGINLPNAFNDDGTLSDEARQALEQTMMATLLGGMPNVSDVLHVLFNSKELDIGVETTALTRMALDVLQLTDARPEYDLRGHLGAAIADYIQWRKRDEADRLEKGRSVSQWHSPQNTRWERYAEQGDMFRELTPEAKLIERRFAEARKMREFRNGAATQASEARAVESVTEWFERVIDASKKTNVETVDLFGAEPAKLVDLMQMKYSVADLREMRFSAGGDFTLTEQEAQTERLAEELAARGEIEHFDAEHLYHGGRDWREPSVAFVGSGQGDSMQGKGFYMTSVRSDADWYARIVQSKATRAKRVAAANGEGSLFKRIGAFMFKTPKFVYELSLHDAHVVSYERTPLPGVARAAEAFVRERGLRGAEHRGWTAERVLATLAKNPSAAVIEICLSRLRHADGSPLTALERAGVFAKGGVDATWLDYGTPAAAEKAVHFVVYNTAKLKTDHKWKNDERMFSVADVRPTSITREFMEGEVAKYGTTKVAGELAYLLPDGRGLKNGGEAVRIGGRTFIGGHDFLWEDAARLYAPPKEAGAADGAAAARVAARRQAATDAARASLFNAGLIRTSGDGIELARRPSAAQYDALWDCLDELAAPAWEDGDDYRMDVDDADGQTLFTVAYRPKTNVRRIIEDIRSYFDENVVPEGATGALPNALKAQGAETAFSTGAAATSVERWKDWLGYRHLTLPGLIPDGASARGWATQKRNDWAAAFAFEEMEKGLMLGTVHVGKTPETCAEYRSAANRREVGTGAYLMLREIGAERVHFGERSLSDFVPRALDAERHYVAPNWSVEEARRHLKAKDDPLHLQACYYAATWRPAEERNVAQYGRPVVAGRVRRPAAFAARLAEAEVEDAVREVIAAKEASVADLAQRVRASGATSVMPFGDSLLLDDAMAEAVADAAGVPLGRSAKVALVGFEGHATGRYVARIKEAVRDGYGVTTILTACHTDGSRTFFPNDLAPGRDGFALLHNYGDAHHALAKMAKYANGQWDATSLGDVKGYESVLNLLYRIPRETLKGSDAPRLLRYCFMYRGADDFARALREERLRTHRAATRQIAARRTWRELGVERILNEGARQTLDDGVLRRHEVDGDLFGVEATDWEFAATHDYRWRDEGEDFGLTEGSARRAFARIVAPHIQGFVEKIANALEYRTASVCILVPSRATGGPDALTGYLAEEVGNWLKAENGIVPHVKFVRVDAKTGRPLDGELEHSPEVETSQLVVLTADAGNGAVLAEVANAARNAAPRTFFRKTVLAALAADAGGEVGVSKTEMSRLRRDPKYAKLSATQLRRLLGYDTDKATLAEIRSGAGTEDHLAAEHAGVGGSVHPARDLGGVSAEVGQDHTPAQSRDAGDRASEEDGLGGEAERFRSARDAIRTLQERKDRGEVSEEEYLEGVGQTLGDYGFSVADPGAAFVEERKPRDVAGLKHVVRAPHGGAQKRGDTVYPDFGAELRDMQFSVAPRRKEEIRSTILSARKDFDEGDIGIILEEIDKYDRPKKVNLAVHWIVTGAITLPQDEYKLDEALKLADKKKGVDLFGFKSPEDVFLAYKTPLVDTRLVNPDDVPELKRSAELADGVVIYDVDETLAPATDALKREYESIKDPIQKKAWWRAAEEHGSLRPKGQVAMRKILNSHWGKEASPWCLLQGDANGNLTPQSLTWWKKYSALPKRVAFKDGRLLAFMGADGSDGMPPIAGQPAGDKHREQWWNRSDMCSLLGIPFRGEVSGDPLHRSASHIYQRKGNKVLGGGLWRGNKSAGRYEEWLDVATLNKRWLTEGGKRIYDIRWNEDGEVEELCRSGESVSRYDSGGRFYASPRYFENHTQVGRLVNVDDKALIRYDDYGATPKMRPQLEITWNGIGGVELYKKQTVAEGGFFKGLPTEIQRLDGQRMTMLTFQRENGDEVAAKFAAGRLRMSELSSVTISTRENEVTLSAHELEKGEQPVVLRDEGKSESRETLEQRLQEARNEIEAVLRKTLDEIDYLVAKYSGENVPPMPAIPADPEMKDKELFALWKSNGEILDAKGEPTAEQIAFARARREAAEEGLEGASYSVADAADGTEGRPVFVANGRQKQGGREYPDIGAALRDAAFSVAKVRADVAKARSELPPERIDAFMAELAKLETPKLKKLCAHWFARGAVELPKDLPRVKYAVKLGELNKRDLFKFASPLDAIRAIEGERGAIGVRINPDNVPYLFNRTDIGDGVVIYDVSETIAPDDDGEYWRRFEEAYRRGDDAERREINYEAEQDGVVLRPCGQIAVRKIMNSHWGKDASPWCLLQGDKNGRLTGRGGDDDTGDAYNAAYYWERYNALPKRVAFKDGEIVSFMGTDDEMEDPRPEQPAGDMCAEQWWDRDDTDYPGVPIVQEIEGDALKRRQVHLHLRNGEIVPYGKIWKGNLKDGVAYVWDWRENPFLQRRQKSVNRRIEEFVAWNSVGNVTSVQTPTFAGRWGGYTGRAEEFAFLENGKKRLGIGFSTRNVGSVATYQNDGRTLDESFGFDSGGVVLYRRRADDSSRIVVEFSRTQRDDEIVFYRDNGDFVSLHTRVGSLGALSLVVTDGNHNVRFAHNEFDDIWNPPTVRALEDADVAKRGEASPIRGLADEVQGLLTDIYHRGALLKEGYDALIDVRPDIPAKTDLTDAEIAAALPKREDYEPERVIERVLAKRAGTHEDAAPKNADAAEAEDQAFSVADETRFAVYNRKYDWDDFKELNPRVVYATTHNHLVGYDHPDKGEVYYRFKFLKAAKRLQEAEGLAGALAASPDPRKRYQGKYLLGKHFGRLPEAREAARHFWSDKRLGQLRQIVGTERPAQWLYVRNDTGRDTNMMPRAFAELLAERFGGEAVGSVYKISDERNTGAGMSARAGRNFRWKGALDTSRNPKVFLVDDMWTTGSTTVSLMEYLKDGGVETAGVVTLAVAANGADIVPTGEDRAKFVRKARVAGMLEAEDAALFDVNRLTGSEMTAYAQKAKAGAFALREWFGTQYGNPGESILEVYDDDRAARLAAQAEAKNAPLFASGAVKPGNVRGKPRQATFDFGAFSVAYPRLDQMSDDELLTSALAIRSAYDPKKYSGQSRSETAYGFMRKHRKEVEDYVSRAHPEWAGDYGKVTSHAAMIMMKAQLEARKIRKALEQGVSESAILDRLPKDMKSVYRGELDTAWRQGAKGALRGEKMLDRVKENARRKATRAVAVQAGVDPALFEQWAGVDFAESLAAVLQNPREAGEDAPKASDASDDAELAEAADALAKAGGGVTGADGKPLDVKALEDPGAFAGYLIDLASRYWREQNGLGEGAAVGQDAVSLQFLRRTMQSVYRRIVREIVYSGARETATRAIDNFGAASTVWSLKSAMTFVGEIVHARHVRETKKELCEKLDALLKTKLGAQGRFKADKEELRRKVSAELELRARYMRHAMWLTKEAAAEEAGRLVRRMEKLSAAYGDADADIDQSREFREIQRELNILREFGALRYRPLTEILSATEYWTNAAQGSGEEILARMREREVRTQKAAAILAAAVNNPRRAERVEGGALQAVNNYVVGHMGFISMLQDMIRYSKGAERQAAEQIVDYIALEIQKAGDRARAETRRQNDAFFRAVETIYGRPFKKVMAEMCARDERFAPFMNVRGGKRVEPTKARAMQLLVSLMQGRRPGDSYFDNVVRHGRQKQGAEIAAMLTQADLRMIEWLRHWYEDNRAGLSEVCEALFGIGVYSESPSYFPVKMLLEKQGLEAAEGVGWTAFPKALTPRVKNERDFDTSADIFSLWASRMDEAAQWKAHARLGLEMRGIFGRSELQEAITSNHGGKINQLVLQFITDILSGHAAADRSDSGVAKAADWIRGWTALTALSWNVGVMVKQTTSIPAFGFEIGLRKTATYTVTAFSPDGWSAMEKIWNSEQRKTRWDVGNSEAVANALRRRDAGAFRRFVLTGMICNKVGDVVPGLVVGQGIYRDCIERGMSEENAMATVWMLIERTQQSARMENQPTQQRRSKLGRLTYQFLSTQQQYLQYEMRAFRELAANPNGKTAKGVLRVVALNHFILTSLYFWMGELYKAILGAEPPEDRLLDWMISNLLGPFGALFILGFCCSETLERLLKGKTYGKSSSMMPMEEFMKRTIGDGVDVMEAIFSNEDTWEDVVHEAMQFLSGFNAPIRDARKIDRNIIRPEVYEADEIRRKKRKAALRRRRE